MKIPNFETKKELFEFLYKNKQTLKAQKKSKEKHAEGIGFVLPINKSITKAAGNSDILHVKAAINSTNIMDTHDDVHIPGLWTKSLKENRFLIHNKEHLPSFEAIIADGEDVKAEAVMYKWDELGFKYPGQTQILLFNSNVKRKRHEYMFTQYKDGNVRNHSVEMTYVKLEMAINDEDYKDEFATWEKYYPMIVNKEIPDGKGYFWAILEAKANGGAAVPQGSNPFTPTIETKEPPEGTHKEPSTDTQKKAVFINLLKS